MPGHENCTNSGKRNGLRTLLVVTMKVALRPSTLKVARQRSGALMARILRPGQAVFLCWPQQAAHWFDAQGGRIHVCGQAVESARSLLAAA